MAKRASLSIIAFLIVASAYALTIKDIKGGLKPADVAQILTGSGVTITNAKITGSDLAIGSFTGGDKDGIGLDAGIILSTGKVSEVNGPNNDSGHTGANGTPGDTDLEALVKPFKTFDAAVLEFDVVTVSPTFAIKYIFASEEYKEYVGSQFNDVFAFFVDGANIALVPGTNEPVTINTINQLKHTDLYRDNPPGSGTINTQFDGMTKVLTATTTVSPGAVHHIKIAIADTSDSILDSAVYIAQGGITGGALAPIVLTVPDELVLSNLQSGTVDVSLFNITGDDLQLSASGLPDDSTVTFTKPKTDADLNLTSKMTVSVGPSTPAGFYLLVIHAVTGDAEGFGTVRVFVDCQPPQILGINQIASQSVTSGQKATLKIVPLGSPPFRFQWYSGHSGFTAFPISGATTDTLQTPAITGASEFWVRVSNPCGSVDSLTVTVAPK